MELRYRGTTYETNEFVTDTTYEAITGQYRGVATKIYRNSTIKIPNTVTTLRYRGVSYII